MISEKIFNTNGTTKIFTSDFEIFSDSHFKVFIDEVEIPNTQFDLINNSIVFETAPADEQQLRLLVSTTPDEFITVDNINIVGVKTVSTIEILKGQIVTYENVYVTGYYERGDGGEGWFYWDAESEEDDNGGTIIKNNLNEVGRFKRMESETINVKQFGAKGDGETDDTDAIQGSIDTGLKVYIPNGTYMVSGLTIYSSTVINGQSHKFTVIKSIAGSNKDLIKSYNYNTEDINNIVLTNFGLNGNYFNGAWNDVSNTYNNTSGGGINLKVHSALIDLDINNIAGIGALFEDTFANQNSEDYGPISRVSITGKDFGKEGIIIKGPNDWILETAFIGRAGILKRPEAETGMASSDYYEDERVSGIVLDGVNIEINDVHVYACWSGTGFHTRNAVRLTKGGRIISESNKGQIYLSSNTYGSATFDIRNLSLYHPDFTAYPEVYSAPSDVWDGAYIDADDFTCDITVKRTITSTKRVVGANAVTVQGSATVNVTYSNSNAPVGDAEYGSLYSGDACVVYGKGATVNVLAQSVNGNGVLVKGEGNKITFSVKDSTIGLTRDSVGNSKRGNNISGSIVNCNLGFNSIGTPTSEIINLAMEMDTGETPFTGNKADPYRGQKWNISASVNNNEIPSITFKDNELFINGTCDLLTSDAFRTSNPSITFTNIADAKGFSGSILITSTTLVTVTNGILLGSLPTTVNTNQLLAYRCDGTNVYYAVATQSA